MFLGTWRQMLMTPICTNLLYVPLAVLGVIAPGEAALMILWINIGWHIVIHSSILHRARRALWCTVFDDPAWHWRVYWLYWKGVGGKTTWSSPSSLKLQHCTEPSATAIYMLHRKSPPCLKSIQRLHIAISPTYTGGWEDHMILPFQP